MIGKIAKAVIKIIMPDVAELLVPLKKYAFEENELDIKCRELEQKVTDLGFRITTLADMLKSKLESVDKIERDMEDISDTFKRFKNKAAFKKLG